MRIALVSDDAILIECMIDTLARNASMVSSFPAESFIPASIDLSGFDLLILDLAMPHQREIEAISAVRDRSLTGTILLTRHFSREDRADALRTGVCTVLEKPADMDELSAAVTNLAVILAAATVTRDADRNKAWALDLDRRRLISPAGNDIPLSSAEMALLEPLFRQTHTPLKREDLQGFRRNWTPASSRILDVVISKLRSKVEHKAAEPFPLRSAKGIGYIFVGTATLTTEENLTPAAP